METSGFCEKKMAKRKKNIQKKIFKKNFAQFNKRFVFFCVQKNADDFLKSRSVQVHFSCLKIVLQQFCKL